MPLLRKGLLKCRNFEGALSATTFTLRHLAVFPIPCPCIFQFNLSSNFFFLLRLSSARTEGMFIKCKICLNN